MDDAEEADLVLQLMNGRYFGKRQVSAATWDGKTKYKFVYLIFKLILVINFFISNKELLRKLKLKIANV